MKFIRRNGRIIPIKDNKGGSAEHDKFAAAGATNKIINRVAMTKEVVDVQGLKFAIKKPRFAALAGLVGAGAFGASMINSYKHGNNAKSFGSGLERAATNFLAYTAGSIGAGMGLKHLKALKKFKKSPVGKGGTINADFNKIG